MKRLFLIRHAKSSWGDADIDDFKRPLNNRGKRNCPEMAERLARLSVLPDLILASPAKRAKKTAICMAKGTGYPVSAISYHEGLYLGSMTYHLDLLEKGFKKADTVFLVGHNYTITELAEFLTDICISNVPTCGVVAIEYAEKEGFSRDTGRGSLLFFDFPKNTAPLRGND